MENNSFKVIVAGGRDFFNYELVKQKLDILLSKKENVVILSAMETGADSLVVRYAREHKLLISWFPATPVKHGSRARFFRNEEMSMYADACVCFWNGKSEGTKHMMECAENMDIPLRVINY
jgi:hypothetical protein